jgi:hypothetical protein
MINEGLVLELDHILRGRTLVALDYFELNALTLGERLEALLPRYG